MAGKAENRTRGDVLIVDDNVDNLRLLTDMLSAAGYKVRPAPNGAMALRSLATIQPDCILLDVRMPEMDGFEVCRRLKADEKTSGIPVLFISGLADVEDKVKGFRVGAVDYIVKPFQQEEVLARVETHVLLSRMRYRLEEEVAERTIELTRTIEQLDAEIRERKKIERQLEEKHKFIESIMENIPDVVYVVDASEFRLLEINRAGEQWFGRTREELVGKNAYDLFPEERADRYKQRFEDVLSRGGMVEYPDARVLTANGEYQWMHTRVVPVFNDDGEPEYLIGISVDITRRREAEEDRSRFFEAVRQSAESIVITDTAATIQFVNPAFERISGYRSEEVVGRNPRILQSGKYDKEFYRQMWDRLSRGKVWQGELVNKKKDGSLFTEDVTISPVMDESGVMVNYIAVKRDVTEERNLEDQLRHAQKMEVVGRLAGGVAHDFNNMLSVILGTTQMLLLRDGLDEGMVRELEQIRAAARRSADITRQLLAFSRKQVIDPKVVDINQLVADITKMLARLLGDDIEIIFVPDEGVGRIKIDPGQLHQVIINLCINARDAMDNGGTLVLETLEVVFDDEYCRQHVGFQPGHFVMLAVSDTGTGIDDDIKEHIFEPFFTTKEEGRGTGLGLASVYGAVKHNKGFINVYSDPGIGTTFKLYFPVCADDENEEVVPKTDVVAVGPLSILLVEDNPMVRQLTTSMLEVMGHTVLVAETPQEAVSLCKTKHPAIDLLLTDVVMPGMTGKVLHQVVSTFYPELKTLFMSGYSANVIAHHGVLDDGVHFLQKPFSMQELAQKISESIRQSRS